MERFPKTLINYKTRQGREPFAEWLQELRDSAGQARIVRRLERVEQGNLGHYERVGNGVVELKERFGPGYWVYIGLDGNHLVILLGGGDKSTQKKDIVISQGRWLDYKLRKEEERHGTEKNDQG